MQIRFRVFLKIKLSTRAFLGFYQNVKVTNRRFSSLKDLLNTKTKTNVCF